MKLSRFKLCSIVFMTVLFLCSQTIVYACDMMMPNVKIRCLNETVELEHPFLEAYVVDKEFSTNPQIADTVARNQNSIKDRLQKIEPCYEKLASIVELRNQSLKTISNLSRDWTGIFLFTPVVEGATINDDPAWYKVNSCLYPWRITNDNWMATTHFVKSYCTGGLVEADCSNTVAPSMEFFALEVAGLRETDMPETVRQRFWPFVGDPFVFMAEYRTKEEEPTTVDISALKASLASLRATIVELTHPAAITATTAATEPIAIAVVPSAPVSDEPLPPTSRRWWSGINLSVVGLLLALTVVELVLLLRRRFTL